jgi:hypothetical protein
VQKEEKNRNPIEQKNKNLGLISERRKRRN